MKPESEPNMEVEWGKRRKQEYGGYLPLEIGCGQEWFHGLERNIRRYNCGRTAIYEAAQAIKADVKKICIPYYICQTVVDAIEQAGIEVKRYSLNENLEPAEEIRVDGGTGVLVVNYFGLKDGFIKEISQKYAHMILDCTQAFFFDPVMRVGVSNIYSCRKFIGVPEGTYLIGQDTSAEQLEEGSAWESYSFLCKAHELGTNRAYKDSLENEKRLGAHKEGMSSLTRRFLQGVDYHFIAKRRKENFKKLHELLGGMNRFDVQRWGGTPQCYPLWLSKNAGRQLKEKLLKKSIYIPTLWKECRELCGKNSLEAEWSSNLLCIPTDQRYSPWDMEFLSVTILKAMEEIKQ